MSIPAICPHCSKTVAIERVLKQDCPECGNQLNFADLQQKRLLIDVRGAKRELETAKSYFQNSDYLNASEHFKKALQFNANSYAAQYFVTLCDIYLNEASDKYDVMGGVMEMIQLALDTMARDSAKVSDKLAFIVAMLTESKVIIMRRLAREELFAKDINEFRRKSIADLATLLELFKFDREKIMLFSSDVSAVLLEIADCAIKTCYRAVQTVIVGEDLFEPSADYYKRLLGLCNDYCFFAQSFNPYFDANNYSPDFTQNYAFNESVLSRFAKFDENNKANAKKNIIGDLEEYDSILEDCKKAVRFTYCNCYRAMCSRQTKQHSRLFFNGLEMLFRLLLPRVTVTDKKKVEIHLGKFVEIEEYCDYLTRFLVDSFDTDQNVGNSLREFYEKLYEIVDMYFVPDLDAIGKSLNKIKEAGGDYSVYQKLLFDGACCCATALRKYVDFSDGEDNKIREKLVKICKTATEDFLMLCDYKIDELEQSNFYRPILKISTDVSEETAE